MGCYCKESRASGLISGIIIYDTSDTGVELTAINDSSATVEFNDESLLIDGNTVYVLVKFDDQLRNDPNTLPFSCDNTEVVTSSISNASVDDTFEATLRFTEAP